MACLILGKNDDKTRKLKQLLYLRAFLNPWIKTAYNPDMSLRR